MTESCFHCGLPVPAGADFPVRYRQSPHATCCAGCQAVAQTIIDAGLDDYYQHRTEDARRAEPLPADLLEQIPEERWATTSLNGEKYAVPANKEVAVSWGFSCVKEMADATGVDYSNIKTEEDLVPLLEAVKEMYPDVWPVVSGGGAMTVLNTNDDLGGDIGSADDVHG